MKPALLWNTHWMQHRYVRYSAITLIAIVMGPYAWSRIVSPWRHIAIQSQHQSLSPTPHDGHLRIVCYNIAHGRGLATSNWKGGNREVRAARLDQIADLLSDLDADVVVLNEVDFDSSWSFSVNQARYLAERAGYAYWAEQRNLDFRVAIWKWRFGNAVLSRYPIVEARVIELPGYSSIETPLAGKKRALSCVLPIGKEQVQVIAVHLCQRSEAIRARSADQIAKLASATEWPTIVAGDFNSTPTGFANSQSDTAWGNALDRFDASDTFRRSPEQPANNPDQFTFHAKHPSTTIDWILIPQVSEFLDYRVVSTELSDHRPVVADVSLVKTDASQTSTEDTNASANAP